MAAWLGYPSQAAALADIATIDANQRFAGDVTATWAVPKADADGTWWIVSPPDTTGLAGVPGTPRWPADPGVP